MISIEPPLPAGPGIYRIVIYVPVAVRVVVGRLGTFALEPGFYVYVGSAKGGLRSRVQRHLGSVKRRRWHIDHLLEQASTTEVHTLLDADASECLWATQTLIESAHPCPIPRFGASDCRCLSHLSYWADVPPELPHGCTRHRVTL